MEADELRRRDDYERGKQAAQIASIMETIVRIENALAAHRKEETDTWERFEASLAELKLWRAKMMGIAGVAAMIVSGLWQLITWQLRRP